jgi:hypothetical protein
VAAAKKNTITTTLTRSHMCKNISFRYGSWISAKTGCTGSRERWGTPALYIKIHFTDNFKVVFQIPNFHGQFQRIFTNKMGLKHGISEQHTIK